MSERKEFQMTEEQKNTLLDAMKPQPVMYLSGGTQMHRSQQERANEAWCKLGRQMGFKGMTVKPSPKGDLYFTAEIAEVIEDEK